MKDLREAAREFDERDKERLAQFNRFGFGANLTESERLHVLEGRFLDALQIITWMCQHIIELEKDNGKDA